MAMGRQVPPDISKLLQQFDYRDAPRNGRSTMMIDALAHDISDVATLRFCRWKTEGLSFQEFWTDDLTAHQDERVNEPQDMSWQTNKMMPPIGVKLWMTNIVVTENGSNFCFDEQSEWFIPHSNTNQVMRCVELFSGGFAG